jgi:predicted porin
LGLKKKTADKNNSVSVALKYAQGDISGMLAHEKTPVGNSVTFLAAKYKLGALSLMGGYDSEKLAAGGKNRSATVSAQWVDGKMSYMAGYGRQLNYDANFFSLGAAYAFKPNTNFYVSYGHQAKGFWGRTDKADAIGLGVNYSF